MITVSVTLLACALIGGVLWSINAAEFRRNAIRVVNEQLDSIVEDLDEQWSLMRNASFKVSTDILYRREYFEQNPYYEIELLKDLSVYNKEVSVSSSHFFMYKNDTRVYWSGEKKYDFDVFVGALGIQEEPQQLYRLINEVETYSVVSCTIKNKPVCILVFPIHVAGVQGKETAAVLCFLITEDSLKDRASIHTGSLNYPIFFCFGNNHFIAINTDTFEMDADGLPARSDKVRAGSSRERIVKTSQKGHITVILDASSDEIRVDMPTFVHLNTLYLFVAVALSLLLAILAGYTIYIPVQRVYKKYYSKNSTGLDELQAIEATLEAFKDENDRYKGNLHDQYLTIKDQLLNLVLNGNKHYADLAASSFMGIKLQGPYYQIIVYKCLQEFSREQDLQIAAAVEDMSDNEAQLYMPSVKYQGYYVILISLREDTDTGMLFEYINELFEPASICGYSVRFSDIHAVPDYLSLAIMDSKPIDTRLTADSRLLDESEMNRMTTALKRGSRDEAVYLFRSCLEELKNETLPETAERYIINILFNRIVKVATERKTTVTPERFYQIISIREISAMAAEIEKVIIELCSQQQDSDKQNVMSNKGDKIVRFLETSFTDKELTLEGVAETFDLSDKYISALIKSITGYTYKEYLIKLRIDKAKELLATTDNSVTEICSLCGYSHIPHFIKTFKSVTGCTPSAYKAKVGTDRTS